MFILSNVLERVGLSDNAGYIPVTLLLTVMP